MRDIERIAPGVVRSFDGKRATYYGTGEDLINAGVVEPHQLPAPGGPKKCVPNPDGWMAQAGTAANRPGQKQIIVKTLPKGVRYEVRVALSAGDCAALAPGPVGKLRPRIGAEVPPPPPKPAMTRTWPFPVSYGRPSHGLATGARA